MATTLPKRYEPLLQYMIDIGYSPVTVNNAYKEAIRFTIRGKSPTPRNYQHLIDSLNYSCQRHMLEIVRDYDLYGILPVPYKRRCPAKERLTQLPDEFKTIYVEYPKCSVNQGLANNTIKTRLTSLSSFLWTCYSVFNRNKLSEITESDIRYYFTSVNGSESIRKNIINALNTCSGIANPIEINRIKSLLPCYPRKTKQPKILDDREVDAIYDEIIRDDSKLSLRDRAIIALCLSTALRCSDIVALELSNVLWESNEIRLLQSKTKKWLRVPLRPFAGNLLYRYITEDRPKGISPKIFLTDDSWPRIMTARHLYNVSLKLFKITGLRQGRRERKGLHVFRHTMATKLIKEGVDMSVASNILGHSNPNTINQYLAVDVERLRDFSISIFKYPVLNERFK